MNWVEEALINIKESVSENFETFNSRTIEADYDAGIYQNCFCFDTYFDNEFYIKLGKISANLEHKISIEMYPYAHGGPLVMRVCISPMKKL